MSLMVSLSNHEVGYRSSSSVGSKRRTSHGVIPAKAGIHPLIA
jgi:hypothetical protein